MKLPLQTAEDNAMTAIYRQVVLAAWVELGLILCGAAVIAGLSQLRG